MTKRLKTFQGITHFRLTVRSTAWYLRPNIDRGRSGLVEQSLLSSAAMGAGAGNHQGVETLWPLSSAQKGAQKKTNH